MSPARALQITTLLALVVLNLIGFNWQAVKRVCYQDSHTSNAMAVLAATGYDFFKKQTAGGSCAGMDSPYGCSQT